MKGYFVLAFLCVALALQAQKIRISVVTGRSISSEATYDAIGIRSGVANKYWGGVRVGLNLISTDKMVLGLDVGGSYRDYGFEENASTIPYGFVGGQLRLEYPLLRVFRLIAFGGGDYGKMIESRYNYVNNTTGSNQHNLFLHQNDAITLHYGGGLGLAFGSANRFGINFTLEKNLQIDSYDATYGKTIGGEFGNVTMYYEF
jgi:hypothetical protein